jgi:hypothetical protein
MMVEVVVVADEKMIADEEIEGEAVRHRLGEYDGGNYRGRKSSTWTNWDTSASFYYSMLLEDDDRIGYDRN